MARTQPSGRDPDPSITAQIKKAGITGLALIIPLVVTLLVLMFVWGFIASLVNPLSTAISNVVGFDSEMQRYLLLGLTTAALAVVVVLIGWIANNTSRTGIEDAFDNAVSSIPGVGGIYSTFNDMSELLLDSDSQSFQEVVLVEYPNEDTFCIAFLTTDTPEFVRETVGKDEMITVFMPMGPNPFMGGFVLHVSGERVHDIDMSVEEGIESIVTSGAALGEHDQAASETPAGGPDGASVEEHGYAAMEEESPSTERTDGGEGA